MSTKRVCSWTFVNFLFCEVFQNILVDVSYYDPVSKHSAYKQLERDHKNIRPIVHQGSYMMCTLCDMIVEVGPHENEWSFHLSTTLHKKNVSNIGHRFMYPFFFFIICCEFTF